MKFTWLLSKSLVVNLHLEIRRCDQVWKATVGHVYLSRCNTVSPLEVFVRGGVVPKEKWIKSQKTLRSDPGQCVMSWWCSFCISRPSAFRAGRQSRAWPLSWALVGTMDLFILQTLSTCTLASAWRWRAREPHLMKTPWATCPAQTWGLSFHCWFLSVSWSPVTWEQWD